MATMAYRDRDRGVAVGRVFERGFSTIRGHFLPTLVIALLFSGLPGTAVDYLLTQLPWQYMVVTVGRVFLPGTFALAIAQWFVSLLFGAIVQGAMTRPAIATSERRRAGLGETLGAALGALFPLVLLGAILGIGVIIGTSLLIVPGMLIYVFWAVAPAAAANERDGVFLALSRSQELSEGARWKVLGIVLILLALSIAVAILMSFLVFLSRGAGWGGSFLIIDLVIRGIFGAIMNVVYGAVQASLYVELAEWKEGGSVEALAQVFV